MHDHARAEYAETDHELKENSIARVEMLDGQIVDAPQDTRRCDRDKAQHERERRRVVRRRRAHNTR